MVVARSDEERHDRDPVPPSQAGLQRVDARLLNPQYAVTVDGVSPRSTVYVRSSLVVSRTDRAATVAMLDEVAASLGWQVTLDESHDGTRLTYAGRARARAHDSGAAVFGVSRLLISVLPNQAAASPDAWVLIQKARALKGVEALRGVGLDHVLSSSPVEV